MSHSSKKICNHRLCILLVNWSTGTNIIKKFVAAKLFVSLRHPAQENLKLERVKSAFDSTLIICLPHYAYYAKSSEFLLL